MPDCSGAGNRSRQFENRVLDPRQLRLQLLHLVELGVSQVPAQLPLTEVQEQLLARPLVQSLPRSARVQLRLESPAVADTQWSSASA